MIRMRPILRPPQCRHIGRLSSVQPVLADNQTTDLSPVVIGATLPLSLQIQSPTTFNDTLPTLQSFSAAQYNGEWLLVGGITNG